MNTFSIVFLFALTLATLTRLWLDRRHINHILAHRDAVPDEFSGQIGLDAHQRAADYTCAKTRLAMVNVVIGKSGKVTSASVTGKFAGTPSGACVEKAIKTASFPPSDGLTTPYPFTLR